MNCIGKKAASTTINQQETGTIDRSKKERNCEFQARRARGVALRAVEAQQTEGDESHP